MKKLLLFASSFLFVHISHAQQKEFGWLIGTWKQEDKPIFETWKLSKDAKTLEGFSYRVKEKDTVTMENIRLTYAGDSFHYIPIVAGEEAPVDFRITRYDRQSFFAENPQHDFPKVIRYRLVIIEHKKLLEASIEGNGKVIPYRFEKIK
jgi:hypothetical protein